jgi:hypothetical protein
MIKPSVRDVYLTKVVGGGIFENQIVLGKPTRVPFQAQSKYSRDLLKQDGAARKTTAL